MESDVRAPTTTEDTEQTVQLCLDVLTWRDAGDELVVFNADDGTYLTVNASAKELWRRLADGTTVAELVRGLCVQHDLPAERASDDVAAFLSSLRRRRLLVEAAP
jgi:Coenzyme PQQ synthesis protein D (PqqD)